VQCCTRLVAVKIDPSSGTLAVLANSIAGRRGRRRERSGKNRQIAKEKDYKAEERKKREERGV
jgi:hypothetical protein